MEISGIDQKMDMDDPQIAGFVDSTAPNVLERTFCKVLWESFAR
jgi:hypothetical protein